MASDISIASNALLLIGDNPINSFDDEGAGAQVAKAMYHETKTQMLSEHPWSFATKQQRLNRLVQTPDILTNYQYAFQLPTDLIRIWNVQDHSDYMLVGDLLYSNATELLCTYIYDVEETQLPPHFVKALQYELAADFAIAVTEDNQMNALYSQKAMQYKSQAMSVDSQGRPQVGIIDSPLIDVRNGGYGSRSGWGS